MKNKLSLSLLCLLLPLFVSAQSDSTRSDVTWYLSVHTGGLLGEKGYGSSFTASALQGIRYKKTSLGVGIGYDAYPDWRILPVFASLAYDFITREKHAWFVLMNGGYSRAWNVTDDEQQFINSKGGGYFFHPQAGYRISSGKFSFYMTAGYKVQHLSYDRAPQWWIWGPPGSSQLTVDHVRERLSVQLGIGLF